MEDPTVIIQSDFSECSRCRHCLFLHGVRKLLITSDVSICTCLQVRDCQPPYPQRALPAFTPRSCQQVMPPVTWSVLCFVFSEHLVCDTIKCPHDNHKGRYCFQHFTNESAGGQVALVKRPESHNCKWQKLDSPDGESATIMWLFLMVTWVTATSRSQKRKVGTKTDRLDSLRKLYGNVTYVIKLSTTENLLH